MKVLKEQLALLLDKSRPNTKECARLTGILISMHVALGPVARLRTRGLYSLIHNRKTWYHRVEWPAEAKGEVEFWWRYFHEFHGKFFVPDPKITAVVSTWSDASDMGWGGYAVHCGDWSAKGNWTIEVVQAIKNSTWRELKATELVLRSLAHVLKGKKVQAPDRQSSGRTHLTSRK